MPGQFEATTVIARPIDETDGGTQVREGFALRQARKDADAFAARIKAAVEAS